MRRIKKSLRSVGMSALRSRPAKRYLEGRMVDRSELLAEGHPDVSEVEEYGGASPVEYPEPPVVGPLPDVIADRPQSVDTPPAMACVCRDARLVGPEGVTFLTDGKALAENSLGWTTRLAVSNGKSLANRTVPRRGGSVSDHYECAVSLVAPWATNYYHWVSDHLLRLEAVERRVDRTGEEPTLLVPPDASAWMLDFLDYLGFGEWDIERIDGGRTHVDRLIVPFLPRETAATAPDIEYLCYTTRPAAFRWFATTLRTETATADGPSTDTRRVYLSRQEATERAVVNLAAVEPVLDRYGIEIIRPERLSIAQQVDLFESADLIVGPHGAALTNMVYGAETAVLELFGDHHHPVFYAMAEQVGHRYTCGVFEQTKNGIRIGPDDLERAIDHALA